jgi:hypothetical protein
MELILEADVVEVEGRSDSELSAHIRECSACAATAKRILSEQLELQQVLRAEHPRTSVDVALARASARAVSPRRRRRMWQTAIPLAAAAGLAGILLSNGSRRDSLDFDWRVSERSAGVGLDIETPPGKNVAVFEVEDRPDIVIVWFYDQGE